MNYPTPQFSEPLRTRTPATSPAVTSWSSTRPRTAARCACCRQPSCYRSSGSSWKSPISQVWDGGVGWRLDINHDCINIAILVSYIPYIYIYVLYVKRYIYIYILDDIRENHNVAYVYLQCIQDWIIPHVFTILLHRMWKWYGNHVEWLYLYEINILQYSWFSIWKFSGNLT